MTATSVDIDSKRKAQEGTVVWYKMAASQTIYQGSLVCLNASGLLVDGADSSGFVFAGVAAQYATSTSGSLDADGNEAGCLVWVKGDFQFVAVSGAQANVGAPLYLADNQTVQAAMTTYGIQVGECSKYISSTALRVQLTA